jgi:ubiquitin carboxyl-terminal hydrolase 10
MGAVVYHHGKFAAGGHYTCDVLRQNEEWMHIDDDFIEMIPETDVVKEYPDRQPYMLFFARS